MPARQSHTSIPARLYVLRCRFHRAEAEASMPSDFKVAAAALVFAAVRPDLFLC